MSLKREFKETVTERVKAKLYNNFLHNYEMIEQKGRIIKYPDRWFQLQGVPTPRQYIEWKEAIEMIGENQFKNLPLETVCVTKKQILFYDKFPELFGKEDELDVTIACGFFWEDHDACRQEMIGFLVKKMKENNLNLTIYTQDNTLKREFKKYCKKSQCKVRPKIYKVPFRIDLHYTIAKNKTNPEKSYCLMELPHSEVFLYRLNIWFKFQEVEKDFDCHNISQFLDFLDQQRKYHIFTKSIPSRFNRAVKRRQK